MYFDGDIITATLLLLFSYAMFDLPKNKNRKSGIRWVYIFIISIPIVTAFFTQIKADENMAYFKRGGVLKCEIGEYNYLVSKEEQWSLKDNFFTKESLLIRADYCQEFE